MQVYLEETQETRDVPAGTTFSDLAAQLYGEKRYGYAAAFADGKLSELGSALPEGAKISFVPVSSEIGFEIYKRSLVLLLLSAFHDVVREGDPSHCLNVLYSLGSGFFCRCPQESLKPDLDMISRIRGKMTEMAEADFPIEKISRETREAAETFEARGFHEKARLLRYRRSSRINLYRLKGYADYFYGYMLPSAGYLKSFDLVPYDDGMVLVLPERDTMKTVPYQAPAKLYGVLRKSEDWGNMLGIGGAGELNDIIVAGKMSSLILVQEALMEKQIADIAERVKQEGRKIVLIAGPSSSGKTTFSRRLSIQLIAHGMHPHPITMDNFFKEREDTPKGPDGKYDFENLGAMDLELFNRDMGDLLAGREVNMPVFDFNSGKKVYPGNRLQIGDEDVLVVEGIHALNPRSTEALDASKAFKVYISALTQLNLDEHNRISTTDTRLLRRIVRDARTRGNDAEKTISMWQNVRRGEEKNIFPFQEEADVMFNSALIYELSAIKQYAEPCLFAVPENSQEYPEAKRLLKFLDYFLGIDVSDVPKNSLMREFIGGGCFQI